MNTITGLYQVSERIRTFLFKERHRDILGKVKTCNKTRIGTLKKYFVPVM